jgi:hypothetical protein
MRIRVTTYRQGFSRRYYPVTDRLELIGETGEASTRLDLAESARRMCGPLCSRVQVGGETYKVSYIDGCPAFERVYGWTPLLPLWRPSMKLTEEQRTALEEVLDRAAGDLSEYLSGLADADFESDNPDEKNREECGKRLAGRQSKP